jgi:HD-like signal output (HDOD) protein
MLPAIAVQLIELSRKPSVTMHEIADLIEQDPILAADMLKITHSAMLSLASPIRTIEEALVRLGMRRSTELFMHAALKAKLFRCRGYDAVLERLRRHSVATAEIARILAVAANVPDDSVYLAGLLHDVGIAGCILALGSAGNYVPLPPFATAWPAILGLQQRFALHLATKWNLPKDIRHILSQTFTFAQCEAPDPRSALTVLAEALAGRVGLEFESECNERDSDRAQRILGLEDARIHELLSEARLLVERLD